MSWLGPVPLPVHVSSHSEVPGRLLGACQHAQSLSKNGLKLKVPVERVAVSMKTVGKRPLLRRGGAVSH
jgi:hypothetical protein